MKRLIDWFSPEVDQSSLIDREGPRRRKLVAFLLVVLGATLFALLTQLLLRHAANAALTTASVAIVLLAALAAVRRGARPWAVTCVVVTVGICVAAVRAMGTGVEGIGSLFWIVLAPLIALPIGGSRAGWITLLGSAAVITFGVVGIEYHWLGPFMGGERPIEMRLASLIGVLATSFLLARASELETQNGMAALQAQNEALSRAQDEAARASRAKSEFLATMSHEIRTPLNGVTGMITLLRDETDPRRVREGLQLIQRSSDVLLAVLTDVLDFSKIESNKLELESLPVAVAREVSVVVALFESSAAEQGDELQLLIGEGVPEWIVGDSTRLRQVITNLVANAVKFTARGRVTVEVKASAGQLTIDVTDTGIGMTEGERARLFEPFVQADASTTRRFGGTGLGLVISRRLVEAMGGTLTARSESGRGSSFTATLPFELAGAPVAQDTAPVPAPMRRSVLVVEDNLVNQMVVVRLLEKLGHEVMVANDGQQGLIEAAKRQFDVVLMDCHMPVMDGYEATKRLRARGDRTPVFALTAAVTTEDRQACLLAGMTGVLSKPLRIERLSEVLEELS